MVTLPWLEMGEQSERQDRAEIKVNHQLIEIVGGASATHHNSSSLPLAALCSMACRMARSSNTGP
jgi:hypothetical protein